MGCLTGMTALLASGRMVVKNGTEMDSITGKTAQLSSFQMVDRNGTGMGCFAGIRNEARTIRAYSVSA
jgi:hypothetical protein